MKTELTLRQRLLSLLAYLLALTIVSGVVTGIWLPTAGGKSIWFFSAIGLLFFTHLTSPFFVTPRDSLANCASAALMLATIDLAPVQYLQGELDLLRWICFSLAAFTSAAAIVAIGLFKADPLEKPRVALLSKVAFRLSDRLGRGQVVFSVPALISIVGFYQSDSIQQVWLLLFWSFLVFVEPVGLAASIAGDLRGLVSSLSQYKTVGEIQRIDDPDIIRVRLTTSKTWKRNQVHIAHLPDSRKTEVIPLFVQVQNAELIGTGLCHHRPVQALRDTRMGYVYSTTEVRAADEVIAELCGQHAAVDLVGFVVENSAISRICFEVSSDVELQQGWLAFVQQRGQSVYYQILDAQTREETFSQNPRGTELVFAEQLGTLDSRKGFSKYSWLPSMNTPVFLPRELPCLPDSDTADVDDLKLGNVPHSEISVRASFNDMLEYHTAILGATGTGKTELAFDIIRFALSRGVKVFCVDFTGEYRPRLADLGPKELGLDQSEAETLQERLFDVEIGEYSATKEKQALRQFVDKISPGIGNQVDEFLQPEGAGLGIFQLEEIANTRATLRATELYLSHIFRWARKNRRQRKILLVLEEGHTIVPEMNLFGYDRVETGAVVGRMAQIALQGRKYGVGLLLISQRTALVSKTLLSQCNTVLCFSMHDETGLNYLSSVFGGNYAGAIPNLGFLQAVAFGKAVRSDRPVIFQVPVDEEKKKASEALGKPPTSGPPEQLTII